MIRRLVAEFVGTFFLVFGVGVSQGQPFTVGGTLWAAMIFTGFSSGGQFNPAVTLAVITRKHITKTLTTQELKELMLYICAQILGSIMAALMSWGIVRFAAFFDVADGYNRGEAFLAEFLYTTLLCANAIMAGVLTDSNLLVGAAVAMSVTAGDWSVGNISGGCFNPAVGFGVNLVHLFKDGDHFGNTWIYIIGPLIGGVLGGLTSTIFIKEIQNERAKIAEENQDHQHRS